MSSQTDLAESTVKAIIFDVVLKAVVARAIAAAPYLAYPIINPVFVYILEKFAGLIYQELDKNLSFTIIDFKTDQERAAYDGAVQNLKDAITIPASPSKSEDQKNAEIEAAKQSFRDHLRDLIRFRP